MSNSQITVRVETIDKTTGDVATCGICGDKVMGCDSFDALREGMRHQRDVHNRRYPWVS